MTERTLIGFGLGDLYVRIAGELEAWEWLDDPDHPVWDLALELAESWPKPALR